MFFENFQKKSFFHFFHSLLIDYENYLLGSFQSVIMMQKSRFSGDLLMNLCLGDNEISDSFSGSCIPLNGMIDDIKLENYNLNWSYLLGPFDIYFDKSWIYYDKLLADKEFGSRFYSSIYFELFEAGIIEIPKRKINLK